MIAELQITEVAAIEEQTQYAFVVDADLIHVGGGSALVDY